MMNHPFTRPYSPLEKAHMNNLALYPGPFTRAVCAGREIMAWYQSFAHAHNFTWMTGKIVFFGIF